MKHRFQTLTSLLLCALLLCLPALAGARMLSGDHQMLQQEAIEAGHLVRQEYTLRLTDLSQQSDPTADLVAQALDVVRLRRDRFDDVDATYESWTLFMQDTVVVTFDIQRADGEIRLRTSLLPDQVLVMEDGADDPLSGPLIALSPFQLFTVYLPNLPGGILSLTEDEVAYIDSALAIYLYEIAAWVSETHRDTGNLYEYILDGIPASDARDAVALGFEVNITATDLKALLRRVADTFYEDEAMYSVVAHYLSAFGVTEQQVYDFSRWLPQEPLSNVDGITPTDESLFFGQYTNEQDELIGLEISLPQLFEEFPVEGVVDYAAKREEQGLRGSGYVWGRLQDVELEGEISLWKGDIIDDTQNHLYSLQLSESGSLNGTLNAYLQREARYVDQDLLQSEYRLNVAQDATGVRQTALDLSGSRETRRLQDAHIEGLDLHTLVLRDSDLSGEGEQEQVLEAVLEIRTTSGAYTVPDFSGKRVLLADLDEEANKALSQELIVGVQQAGFLAVSLLPQELLTELGTQFSQPE